MDALTTSISRYIKSNWGRSCSSRLNVNFNRPSGDATIEDSADAFAGASVNEQSKTRSRSNWNEVDTAISREQGQNKDSTGSLVATVRQHLECAAMEKDVSAIVLEAAQSSSRCFDGKFPRFEDTKRRRY
jgi:hypothetical protein